MIRRMLAVSALAATVALTGLAGATAASAAPYPPSGSGVLAASGYQPCAGGTDVIGGGGFQSGETVSVRFPGSGEIARAEADSTGTFQATVTIPLSARGTNQLTATGLSSGVTSAVTLEISCVVGQDDGDGGGDPASASAAGTGGGGDLAFTGVEIGGAVLAGVVLLGAGGALVVAGRRRRSPSALG